MQSQFFDTAAVWVLERQNFTMFQPPSAEEIARTLDALHALVCQCDTSVLIPDLMPGVALEALYVAPATQEAAARWHDGTAFVKSSLDISANALSAIGRAVDQEFTATGQDMVRYEIEGGGEALIFTPTVRETVLKATGLTLLGA
jgi:hypothetical protein